MIFITNLDFSQEDSLSKQEEIKKRITYNKKRDYNKTSIENDVYNKRVDLAGYLIVNGFEISKKINSWNEKSKINYFYKYLDDTKVTCQFLQRPKELKLRIKTSVEGKLNPETKIGDLININNLRNFILEGDNL